MRNSIYILFISALLLGCSKDDDGNYVAPISHDFALTFDENYDSNAVSQADITVTNNEDGVVYTGTSDTEGVVTLSVLPGTYTITATRTFTAEEYFTFSGQEVAQEVVFNASAENILINEETSTTTTLELVTGKIGDLILKQIYYSGSDVRNGALYRDQFFEVHNNSNETIYLDGVYFAQVYGATSVSSNLKPYHQSNGQYDWSQSIGQTDVNNANSDYIYVDEVIQFPGSGTEYPLEPGKSTIVAATAVNHKAPLTVEDDEGETVVYEVVNPDLTIDLSNAPFETYFRQYQESQGSSFLDSDIDNPNAVNMNIAFKTFAGKDLILDPMGRDAFAIFRADDAVFNGWNTVPLPSITADNFDEDTSVYLQIPVSVILDGVETQRNDPSKAKPKRLTDAIDAGEISTIQGHYTSESIIRKVSAEIDGKVFYQDTNNSANDFEVLARPQVVIE